MKKLSLILSAGVLLLSSCGNNQEYVIEGTLYGGSSFEGETIWMVPFSETSGSAVDSCIIRDGRFVFEGEMEGSELYVMRMRPMMSLFIDQLIFIKEPGHIRATLSRPSVAVGSPLNDSLQTWMKYKLHTDSLFRDLNMRINAAEGEAKEQLQSEYDELKNDFDRTNKGIIERNDNAFGNFLDKYFL